MNELGDYWLWYQISTDYISEGELNSIIMTQIIQKSAAQSHILETEFNFILNTNGFARLNLYKWQHSYFGENLLDKSF